MGEGLTLVQGNSRSSSKRSFRKKHRHLRSGNEREGGGVRRGKTIPRKGWTGPMLQPPDNGISEGSVMQKTKTPHRKGGICENGSKLSKAEGKEKRASKGKSCAREGHLGVRAHQFEL